MDAMQDESWSNDLLFIFLKNDIRKKTMKIIIKKTHQL
jgi:hypothetical protein